MTDAELSALKAARAKGIQSFAFQGNSFVYRGLAEMDQIIHEEELARAGRRRVGAIRARLSKGFY